MSQEMNSEPQPLNKCETFKNPKTRERDCTGIKVLVLHAAKPGSIPYTTYGQSPKTVPEVTPEHRAEVSLAHGQVWTKRQHLKIQWHIKFTSRNQGSTWGQEAAGFSAILDSRKAPSTGGGSAGMTAPKISSGAKKNQGVQWWDSQRTGKSEIQSKGNSPAKSSLLSCINK